MDRCAEETWIEAPDVRPASTATPWSRYWSRVFDLTIWIFIVSFLFGGLFPDLFLKFSEATKGNDLLLGMAILPIALVFDAICLAAFGQTLGRAIAGIRVTKLDGNRLTATEAVTRNFLVYLKGLGLGIPIISLFTLIASYNRLKNHNETSWDVSTDTLVSAIGSNFARTCLVGTLYIAALGGLTAWSKEREIKIDGEIPRANSSADPDPVEDQLRAAAFEMRRDLPKKLDEITTLTNINVMGRTLVYIYSISRRDASDTELRDFVENTKLVGMCKNQQMRHLMKDYGVTYRYSYLMPGADKTIDVDINEIKCSARRV